MHQNHSVQRWRGRAVFVLFGALLISELPLVWLLERLVETQRRASLWRLVAHKNCLIFLHLWGVQTKSLYTPPPQSPQIYACNHPSFVDGLILFALLGPDIVALTAPFSSFPFPLGFWFKRMGFVDIQRDNDDAFRYPHANTKHGAFIKLLNYLQAGVNVFMFPEGHVERHQQLHYIHTGVARLSLQAHVPVQVMTLVGMEKVYAGGSRLIPGNLTVRYGKRMDPPALSQYVPFRKAVRPYARDVERQLVTILPVRYLPDYYHATAEGTAAFFDVDHTLYDGYAQKDFVNYLLKLNVLPRTLPLRVLYWIALEKVHMLNHRSLMKLAFGTMRGLSVKQMDKLCQQFFTEIAVHKINHQLLPILKDHRAKGHVVIIVTELFQPLARQFQRYVGASGCLDTVLAQHRGRYTGEVTTLNHGYTKAEQIEQFAQLFNINLLRSYAYADATSDLPMLYTCRHKIPVNPDKHLKKVATVQGWPTL